MREPDATAALLASAVMDSLDDLQLAFDTSDLTALAASARSLADAGADGMIVVGPQDPAAIGPVGAVLADAFPG